MHGFFLDLFLLLICFVDSLSGIAVAFEFYEKDDDQNNFFNIITLVLILGAFVESITFLRSLRQSLRNETFNTVSAQWKVPRRVATVCLTALLSPILPIVHYFIIKTEYFDSSKTPVNNNSGNYSKCDDDSGANWNNVNNKNNKQQDATWSKLPTLDVNDVPQKSKVFHAGNEFESYSTTPNDNKNRVFPEVDEATLSDAVTCISSRRAALFMANVHALSTSLPRSVVLIIFMALTGQATPIQVFTLSLSLFYLAGKAPPLCRSLSPKHFCANVAFVGFDVFSAALMFSSNFSSHSSSSSSSSSWSIRSWMFQIWTVLRIQSVVLLVVVFVVRNIITLNERLKARANLPADSLTFFGKVKYCGSWSLAHAKLIVVVAAFQVLLLLAILVIAEVTKFGWLFLYYLLYRVPPSQFYLHRLLHEFIWRKDTTHENAKDCCEKKKGGNFRIAFPPNYNWQSSLDLLRPALDQEILNCIDALNGPVEKMQSLTPSSSASRLLAGCLKNGDDDDDSEQPDKPVDSALQRIRHILLCDIFFRVTSICPARCPTNTIASCVKARTTLANATKLATWDKGDVAASPDFSWFHLLHYCVLPRQEKAVIKSFSFSSLSKLDQVGCVVLAYVWLSYFLYGFLYPFMSLAGYLFSLREQEQEFLTPMAKVCLVICLPFGILSAALVVDAIKTQITCSVAQQLQYSLYFARRMQNSSVKYYEFLVDGVIPSYFSPIANVLHQVAIREDSKLPFDCFEKHVACFLKGEHVSLYGMTKNERRKLIDDVTE